MAFGHAAQVPRTTQQKTFFLPQDVRAFENNIENLAGKYWSPEHPDDVPLKCPQDVPERSYLTIPGMSQSDVQGTS